MSATIFVRNMHQVAHERSVGMLPEAHARKHLNVSRKRAQLVNQHIT